MTSTAAHHLDALFAGALHPLDVVRSFLLRLFGRFVRPLFQDRDARVAVLAFVSMVIALGFTLRFPLLLLSIGPLVLGVPHLLADVRYLVVRQGLHYKPAFFLAILLPAVLAGLLGKAWVGHFAILGAVLLVPGVPLARVLFVLCCWAGMSVLSLSLGWTWDLLFGHLHNVIALGLWCAWARVDGPRSLRFRGFVLVLFGLCCTAIIAGWGDRWLFGTSALRPLAAGTEVETFAQSLSFVVPSDDPVGSVRWVQLFAFTQSVHYAVWLRLMPDEDRGRGVRPFVSSYRALVQDVGRIPVLLTAGLTLFFCVWGCWSLAASRLGYLRLAHWHGHLELGVASYLFCRAQLQRGVSEPC